jgi:hypothetical protein
MDNYKNSFVHSRIEEVNEKRLDKAFIRCAILFIALLFCVACWYWIINGILYVMSILF